MLPDWCTWDADYRADVEDVARLLAAVAECRPGRRVAADPAGPARP